VSNSSSFWRPENAIAAVFLNPPLHCNCLHICHCSTFWEHEKCFFKGHETLGSIASCFHWSTVQYSGGLKMRFLKRPEPSAQGPLWAHIRHFRGLKTQFLVRRETLGYGYMGFVKAFLVITFPEDMIPQGPWDPIPIAI
jgi:hypothetical protein